MVIVIGDISVGSSKCNRQWSLRFNALVSSYQDVVRLMVFGGAKDSFNLFNLDLLTGSWGVEGQGVNVAHVGGPLNRRSQEGAFRIYTVTQAHNLPVKIETYGLIDLDIASATE